MSYIDAYEKRGQRSVKVVCYVHRIFCFAVAVFGKIFNTDLVHGGKCAFGTCKVTAENNKNYKNSDQHKLSPSIKVPSP